MTAIILWLLGMFSPIASLFIIFPHPEEPLKIAACESHFDNSQVGDAGELSFMQIHPIHFDYYNPKLLKLLPIYAAMAAWELSGRGKNYQPWEGCR